jgi:ATP-dependent DNA helicase DinG
MSDYIDDVFGERGLFAGHFPNYEPRQGQVALARMVDQAMRDGNHLLAEGPCGTGKGVAYGVPATWHACHNKQKVVIVTANIALQEQLIRKDLPMLAEILPWKFSFALLKGRQNYLCIDRLAKEKEARAQRKLTIVGNDDPVERLLDPIVTWAAVTTTGDKAELPRVPPMAVWSKVAVGLDDCKGDLCTFNADCFSEQSKRAAASKHVIVTNYHMLFAHLALRQKTGKDIVLPKFDLLVLDEAHEAAAIARDFFGFSLSEKGVTRLATYAIDYAKKDIADDITKCAAEFFADVAAFAKSKSYRRSLSTPGFADATRLNGTLSRLWRFATDRFEDTDSSQDDRAEARIAVQATETVQARIAETIAQAKPNNVYWIELDEKKTQPKLRSVPLDVSGVLSAELFAKTVSATLTSATLTTNSTFDFIRREVGAPEAGLSIAANTPFDFENQALLVIPDGMPDPSPHPRDPRYAAALIEFVDAVADTLRRVITMCNGRTLGLFTSYRNLEMVYDRIKDMNHRILRQERDGELARTQLADMFKQDVHSSLLATASFWTGVDVPGEALTALVIDKLPFPSPEDPVVDAIWQRDTNAFYNYLVPKAIIDLRQGVGRLIRSQKDVGVVVICDRRLIQKAYGGLFLKSLPKMRRSRRLDDIAKFLKRSKP